MREVYPAQLAGYLRESVCTEPIQRNPELPALRQQYSTALKNLKRLADGGVSIVLGTNSGAADTYPGYFELREMISMVDAGMKPMDVIKAATSNICRCSGDCGPRRDCRGKTADFLSMPNNLLRKIANIKDVGNLYFEWFGTGTICADSDISISTEDLKITQKERAADAEAEAQAAREKAEAGLPHYGKFVLGQSQSVRYMPIPTPKGSKADVKIGPPDRITVSMKASAAELREFYARALPTYKWTAAGNCWQKEHPSSHKPQTLCVEAANNSAVIQISEK
jgi:hypothetical protein